ncbi:hypothetical protein [Edwardsiella tarda]|uniref:hypothetical protein n=1 Tax=Edwardsiella tarda TaxID=636 RepID=UPI00351BF5FF
MTTTTTVPTTTTASNYHRESFTHKIRTHRHMLHLLNSEPRFINSRHAAPVRDNLAATLAGSRRIPKLTGFEAGFKSVLYELAKFDLKKMDAESAMQAESPHVVSYAHGGE